MPEPAAVARTTKVLVKSYDPETGCKCFNQYRFLQEIGRGSFGKVELCSNENGTLFAVKICRRPSTKVHFGSAAKAFTAGFNNEVDIWRGLRHENIVQLHEVVDADTSPKVYLVMEFLPGGPVHYANEENEPLLSLAEAQHYFSCLVRGLVYLHNTARIVHRDIKPENLLLSANGTVKICDFGSAQRISDQMQHRRTLGSPAFFAPELCVDDTCQVTTAVDVWAAGLCLYMFVFGVMPFYALSNAELHRQIVNNHIVLPWETDDQLHDLILGCLVKDPSKRLTAEETWAHPWLRKRQDLPLKLADDESWSASQLLRAVIEWPSRLGAVALFYAQRFFGWLLWGWH